MQEQVQGTKREALRDLAQQAGLTLSDEELEQLAARLEGVLQNIRRLDSLDLSQREPATPLHLWWS